MFIVALWPLTCICLYIIVTEWLEAIKGAIQGLNWIGRQSCTFTEVQVQVNTHACDIKRMLAGLRNFMKTLDELSIKILKYLQQLFGRWVKVIALVCLLHDLIRAEVLDLRWYNTKQAAFFSENVIL